MFDCSRIRWLGRATLIVIACVGSAAPVAAEKFCRKATLRPAAPPGRYGHDDIRAGASVVSSAGVEEVVVQILTDPELRPIPNQPLAEQWWHTRPRNVAAPMPIRRRAFAPLNPSLVVAPMHLDRIALAIYETGELACTGLISHDGGPNGLVRGNSVEIRVRGYGQNRLTSTSAPNGPLLFECRQPCWVSRGEVTAVSLTPADWCEAARRHFDEITFVEVNLEVRQSRKGFRGPHGRRGLPCAARSRSSRGA